MLRFVDFCMEVAEVWFREYLDFDWYYINIELGMGMFVVYMEIDFKGLLYGGDGLVVEVDVVWVGSKFFILCFEGCKKFVNGDVSLLFVGCFVYCFISKVLGGKVMLIFEV